MGGHGTEVGGGRKMKAIILGAALTLLTVASAPAHDGHGERDDRWEYPGSHQRDSRRDGDRHDGIHYGRYRPFYSYPLRDCPDEPRRYNRRTGRMEPACEVPCAGD